MPDLDHDALMKISEAATVIAPSPWRISDDQCVRDAEGGIIFDASCDHSGDGEWQRIALFLMMADPSVVISVLTERLADKARIARLEEGDARSVAEIDALEQMLRNQQASLAAKDAEIERLREALDHVHKAS